MYSLKTPLALRRFVWLLLWIALSIGGCQEVTRGLEMGDADAPASVDVRADTQAPSDAVADGGEDAADAEADVAEAPAEYVRRFDAAGDFPAPAGKRWRRAIIHLHSTHSHDACDGQPRLEDGSYNGPCLASLREALCEVKIDVAFLTDHRTELGGTPFVDALLHDPTTDALIERDGQAIANEIRCEDGFVVTTTVGMEGELMPLGFAGPLDPDPVTNEALLSGEDAASAQRFRDGGALIWTAHTESKTLEQLREWAVDGLEIYNLHANIDPRIRADFLGLDGFGFFEALIPFVNPIPGRETLTHPDLALLVFLDVNRPSLERWGVLLEERLVVGSGGTDAHQNVLPTPAGDGERFDSYRRMMSWFSNYILSDGEGIEASREGLSRGRVFIGFDTLGSPAGFDLGLLRGDGERLEMGATLDFEPGLTLEVNAPTPSPSLDPEVAAPEIETRILRFDGAAWETVHTEEGSGLLSWPIDAAGIYRVEVWMRPLHLARHIDAQLPQDLTTRQYPWIYSNALRVLSP